MPDTPPPDERTATEADPSPRAVAFDDRAGFVEAVLGVLRSAKQELIVADRDFSGWPIESLDGETALRAFLRDGGRLRLLVADPGWLDRHGARFARLRRTWSDRIACRAVPATARFDESLAAADRQHLMRRLTPEAMRGVVVTGDLAQAAAACQRVDALWEESEPCLPPTTLGL